MNISDRGLADPLDGILRSAVMLESLEERFWSKVDSRGDNECWPWTGCKTAFGYGRMSAAGRVSLKAHRVSYALSVRASPGRWMVCHSCDNPECCNPDHLFLGTHKDNTMDAMVKGRLVMPPVYSRSNHPRATLSVHDVMAIQNSSDSSRIAAEKFSVSQRHINRIRATKGFQNANVDQ